MRNLLPLLQILLVLTILMWDVALTARIVQVRNLPRAFVAITAIAGFLLLPSLVIHLATTSSITGRAVTQVDWLWPFTLVLFALQALYAALRRFVNPFIGFFIASYDVLIATDGVLRSIAASGQILPAPALIFLAATTGAFSVALSSPTVIGSPFFVLVPMIAPAFPALRRATATFRLFLALVAGAWVVLFISQLTQADQAVNSYRIHDPATEKLQERPEGDFDIGLKILPDLADAPSPVAIRNDLQLADTLGVSVVSVVIIPEEMDRQALDSLAHTLDLLRRDSTELIVTMGYPRQIFSFSGRTFNDSRRLETIERVVRRLHPDILLPAEDPYDSGTRAAGERAPQYWESFLRARVGDRQARRPSRAHRRLRVGVRSARQHALRMGRRARIAGGRGRLLALPVAHGRSHARCGDARRRSLDARVQLVEGPLGLRRGRLPRSTRRSEPGARPLVRARVGDEPTVDQGAGRQRSGRLRHDHGPSRPRRPPPPRDVRDHDGHARIEGSAAGRAYAEGTVTAKDNTRSE